MLRLLLTILITISAHAETAPFSVIMQPPEMKFCREVITHAEKGGLSLFLLPNIDRAFKHLPKDIPLEELRTIIANTMELKNRNTALTRCMDEVKSVRFSNSLNPLSGTMGFSKIVDDENVTAQKREIEQQRACEAIKYDPICTALDTGEGINALFDVSRFFLEKTGCECLAETLERDFRDRPGSLEEQKKASGERIHQMILSSFGEKFVNDYAMNMEDVGFFQTNTAQFFGADQVTQDKSAMEYQCSDIQKYQTSIDLKCQRTGISNEEKQSRIDSVFNAFDKSSGRNNLSLTERFNDLNRKVQVLDFDVTGGTDNYARRDHDVKRFGLSRRESAMILLNDAVMHVMRSPALKIKLRHFLAENKKPMEAIALVMRQEASRNPQEFVQRFLKNEKVSQNYRDKAFQLLKDNQASLTTKTDLYIEQIEIAMGIHPGIKAMMLDEATFYRAAQKAKKENKSLVEALEMDDEILGPEYRKRCHDLVEKLSEAVCMPQKDLIGNVNANDLTSLLGRQGKIFNSPVEQLLICEAGNSEKNLDVFNDLRMKNAYSRSDLLDRLTNPKERQTNSFRRLKETENEEVKEIVSVGLNETIGMRQEVKNSNLASNKFSAVRSSEKTVVTEVKDLVNPLNSSTGSKSTRQVESFEGAAPATNLNMSPNMASSSAAVAARPVDVRGPDARNEIRDTISNKDNQDRVDNLLSNADDSAMKELLRLKEEGLRDRQKLLELTNDSEKLKLKTLEDKIKLLEEQKASVAKNMEDASKEDLEDSRPKNSLRALNREIASLRPVDTSGSQSGDFGGSKTSSSSSPGAASVGRSSGGNSAAARGNGPEKNSESGSAGYIVVSRVGVSSDESLKSQEVSQGLIDLLSSSDPDLTALKKLKDSGMLYKFKVMENGILVEKEILVDYKMLSEDAKKLVEEKLAKKQNSNVADLDHQLMTARRVHSFQALKIILGEQLKNTP